MNSSVVIQCKNLSKTYADGELRVEVLKSIDLAIQESAMLAIIGPSGSGKSTLLHLLGGLDKPTSGEISVVGKNLNRLSEAKKSRMRNKYLGFVYQFHHLLPEFDAVENVAMPLLLAGSAPSKSLAKAKEMLVQVGLGRRIKHRVAELSGGERQRVAIARALITEPICVLADEPTGNLDQHNAEKVHELMSFLNKRLKISFVVATHDINMAKNMDKTLTLVDGKLV